MKAVGLRVALLAGESRQGIHLTWERLYFFLYVQTTGRGRKFDFS